MEVVGGKEEEAPLSEGETGSPIFTFGVTTSSSICIFSAIMIIYLIRGRKAYGNVVMESEVIA